MENRNKHIAAFLIIAVVVLLIGVALDIKNKAGLGNQSGYQLVLVQKDTGNWYYEIHYASELKIRQEFVPGLPGNVDFRTRKLAEKTGKLVLAKLQKGHQPIITSGELRKNGVID
ncbi:MAG: hypothetical protein Mars2KO_31920 [Maribacter sp.]